MVSFFIPKKINVGFRERSDTYTGKLGYIIYFDEKGVLRKEKSWDGWRDEKIDNIIHDNEPTSGFVLNKKAGGYSTGWNHRQTYVRVYDPRGFEFEINVQNLLYILENATSTKGKGLEGDFVYGWDGKDLVLIPVDSPDYKELAKLNALRHSKNFIKTKELKLGATYRSKNNNEVIYMGRFDEYDYDGDKKAKTQFYFYSNGYFQTMASISQHLVEVVSEEPVANYADLMDKLEKQTKYSPIDATKNEYMPYTIEEVIEKLDSQHSYMYMYAEIKGEIVEVEMRNYGGNPYYYVKELVESEYGWYKEKRTRMESVRKEASSVEEMFNIVKPLKKRTYLANGKLYSEGGRY